MNARYAGFGSANGPDSTSGEYIILGLIGVGLAVIGTVAAVVEVAALFAGHPGPGLTVKALGSGVTRWHSFAGQPRDAFPEPLRASLPGPLDMYAAVGVVAATALLIGWPGWRVWERCSTGGRAHQKALRHQRWSKGFADPRVVADKLSKAEGSINLGRPYRARKNAYAGPERSVGLLMEPRTGKSGFCMNTILDSPAAVVVTSSKPELLYGTGLARERATGEPTLVFDPLGHAPRWAHHVRWSPIIGCEDPKVAARRADSLMAGMGTETVSNAEFWRSAGTILLRCVLHVAALGGAGVHELRAWVANPSDAEVRGLIARSDRASQWAADLDLMSRGASQTTESVGLTVANALECLAIPEVAAACSPSPGEAFDPAAWIASGGTVHVIAPEAEGASVAPLSAALIDELMLAARRAASLRPDGKLERTMRFVLDELPNVCPLRNLDSYLSDSGGRNIQIVWAAQSRYQLLTRYGSDKTGTILGTTKTLLVGGGLGDLDLYRDMSTLSGTFDERRHGHSSDATGARSDNEHFERVAVLSEADLFKIDDLHALMTAGGIGATVLRLPMSWERPDARQLAADLATVTATPARTAPTPTAERTS
jgi:type IV secretory pathway TraG/TraD family ATPase VirD4